MGGKQLGFSNYEQTTALPRPQAERTGGTRSRPSVRSSWPRWKRWCLGRPCLI
jgi:hypothetical protein